MVIEKQPSALDSLSDCIRLEMDQCDDVYVVG